MRTTQRVLKTKPKHRLDPTLILLFTLFFLVTACSNDDDPVGNNGTPTIIGINPSEGRVGETIQVRGTNFAVFPQDNQFFFNGIKAEIYVGIRNELLVRVPFEASTGPVSILVPGFDTVRGPEFTVERIASITRTSFFYVQGRRLGRATFDQANNVISEVFSFEENTGILNLGGVEVDITEEKAYLIEGQPGQPAIYRVNLDGTGLEIIYDVSDSTLVTAGPEPQILNRLTLDLQEEYLYVTDGAGRILQGSLDGGEPLRVVYDDGQGYNTIPRGISMAIGSQYIYWSEVLSSQVMRILIDGSGTPEVIYDNSNGLIQPIEIVIDEAGNRIFITDDPQLQNGENVDRILLGSLDGTQELETLFEGNSDMVSNAQFGLALDVENNLLYWGGRPFAGASAGELVIVTANLAEEDPQPDVIADQDDIPGLNNFTMVVTEEGGSNGRLRARVVGQ